MDQRPNGFFALTGIQHRRTCNPHCLQARLCRPLCNTVTAADTVNVTTHRACAHSLISISSSRGQTVCCSSTVVQQITQQEAALHACSCTQAPQEAHSCELQPLSHSDACQTITLQKPPRAHLARCPYKESCRLSLLGCIAAICSDRAAWTAEPRQPSRRQAMAAP